MVGKKRAPAPAPLDVEPVCVPASLEREPLVVPTTPRSRLNTALCPGPHQARRTVFLFLVHVLPMSSKLIRARAACLVITLGSVRHSNDGAVQTSQCQTESDVSLAFRRRGTIYLRGEKNA